jgi:hypothetical protein
MNPNLSLGFRFFVTPDFGQPFGGHDQLRPDHQPGEKTIEVGYPHAVCALGHDAE